MDNSFLTPSLEVPWLTWLPLTLTHVDPAPLYPYHEGLQLAPSGAQA